MKGAVILREEQNKKLGQTDGSILCFSGRTEEDGGSRKEKRGHELCSVERSEREKHTWRVKDWSRRGVTHDRLGQQGVIRVVSALRSKERVC